MITANTPGGPRQVLAFGTSTARHAARRTVIMPIAAARGLGPTCRATVRYVRTVTHREMRNNSGDILRAVAEGETVQVTNNGVLAAVISPPSSATFEDLAARGQARRARRPLTDLSTIRRREATLTTSELVADARGRW